MSQSVPTSVSAAIQQEEWALSWWLPRHQAKIDERKQMNNRVDLVFLGDSITHAWEDKGWSTWQSRFAPRRALNLGFAGDRTENVLWRVQNGAIDDLDPKLLVLLIGTNNAGCRGDSAEAIAAGIRAILDTVQEKLPRTRILLQAIFPRGHTPDDPLRQVTGQANQLIRQYADDRTVFFQDIGQHFLDKEQTIQPAVMEDMLHPTPSQYPVWADALEPMIAYLMDEREVAV